MRRLTHLFGLVLIAILLAAACSATDDDDAGGAAEARGEPTTNADTAASVQDETTSVAGEASPGTDSDGEGGEGDADGVLVVGPRPALDGRSLIFTATLSVAAENVATATVEAQAAVEPLGGFVFAQESVGGGEPRTILTFKVPPDRFGDAVGRLAGVGELLSQTVATDDVTERVVDLESQIRTAEASVDRLRQLITEAGSIDNIATLEAQLLDRETQLEQLRGQLRTIEGQVALATVVVTFTQADLVSSGVSLSATALAGEPSPDRCQGREGIQLDDGEAITYCYAVTNTGVTELTDVVVTDEVLGVATGDLTVVDGDKDVLAAGETVVFSYATTVDGDVRTSAAVSALTGNGDEVGAVDSVQVAALGGKGSLGFGDSMTASIGAIVDLGRLVVIGAGFLLPFLLLALPFAAVAWWLRRRRGTGEPTSGLDSEVLEVRVETGEDVSGDPGATVGAGHGESSGVEA